MSKKPDSTIEILGNVELSKAFEDLNIKATKTYQGEEYCVWAISKSGLDKITNIPNENWKDEWGWWRYATGCNISDYPTHTFTVSRKTMIGYYIPERLDHYIEYWSDDGYMTEEEAKEDYFSRKYEGIRNYLCDAIGASTESNVCAIAVDLAKINNMTLGELFSAYGE